jgi:hypothetical protein
MKQENKEVLYGTRLTILILKPTWRNKQVDNGGIYKILDRFLIEENILDNVGKPYLG